MTTLRRTAAVLVALAGTLIAGHAMACDAQEAQQQPPAASAPAASADAEIETPPVKAEPAGPYRGLFRHLLWYSPRQLDCVRYVA
jgi:hypothetical protein